MGSRVWFKNIIGRKKAKGGTTWQNTQQKHPSRDASGNGTSDGHRAQIGRSVENAAATRIQTAFRAHMARKSYRRMRGMARLKHLVQRDFVKKQASATLRHLHSWSRIQEQVRARRARMITEGRARQKKQENQLNLEAKLHDLEVDWTGGTETMDEALAKIHQREEAAVRRERAMAYAFSHQWRANSSPSFGSGNYEISKENWGWSWMDRWIAVRPWESRIPPSASPKKSQTRPASKTHKKVITPTSKAPVKVKLASPNGKAARKTQKLAGEVADKTSAPSVTSKAEEDISKNQQEGS